MSAAIDSPIETNRRKWDERVAVHRADRTGSMRSRRSGAAATCCCRSSRREIGDVAGKRLLHLQCHFGLDTLSLARRGAVVDRRRFLGAGDRTARGLATEAGLAARFVEMQRL